MTPRQAASELRDLQEQMLDLLEQAKDVIRKGSSNDKMIYERAKSYWLAHAQMALTKEHDYLGSSGVDMDDTIQELEESGEEE